MGNEVMYIKLDDIIPNRFQPREIFDEKALNELADSIRQHGVIEPIIVRPVANNKFEIVAGERRYKATAIAGLTKIPALVKQMDDKESSLVAFIENEHRRDVSAIEKARTSERLLKTNNMTQEELASTLGISQSTLANRLRLLDLPLEVQDSLMRNEISERHARSLLSVKDPAKQIELLNKVKEKRMTVRELESEIKAMNNGMMNNQNMNYNMPNNNFLPNNGMMNNQNNNNYNQFNNQPNNMNNYNQYNNQSNNMNNHNSNDFENYLNNNMPNNNYLNQNNTSNDVDNGFMEFLKKYDDVAPTPVSEPKTNAIPAGNNGMNMNTNNDNNNGGYMNMVDNNQSLPSNNYEMNNNYNNNQNNSFMSQDNQYNNGYNMNNTTYNNNIDNNEPIGGNNNFMNYLNNYDNNNQLSNDFNSEQINNSPMNNNNSYLNNYDNNMTESYSNYNNFGGDNNNVMINSVNPPITSNFNNNSYVEDNPNYTDISKNIVLDSVDDIIEDLKTTINKIKNESKYKIDTEEINFDDIYQITIKIDKRNF